MEDSRQPRKPGDTAESCVGGGAITTASLLTGQHVEMGRRFKREWIQVLFLPPSDAYVRSFLYLLYTLVKLYYTHTHKKECL